jgi:uncharacterized protein (DUF486 family)
VGVGPAGASQTSLARNRRVAVFVPFAVLYMRQPIKTDSLWAGLCLVGAVYFVFRS